MDKLTLLKVISKISDHIKELKQLPGNPVGREQAIMELKLLADELKKEIK